MNRIYSNLNRTLLIALTPLLMLGCKSREERISDIDNKLKNLESEYVATENKFEDLITDSLNRKPGYKQLDDHLNLMMSFVEDVRMETDEILFKIQDAQIEKMARQYPLSAFMTRDELWRLRRSLRGIQLSGYQHHVENIIRGRGNLYDLYSICFYLDYESNDYPFYIHDLAGRVRFINNAKNALCDEFDAKSEKIQQRVYNAPLSEKLTETTRGQLATNRRILNYYDSLEHVRDSIYSDTYRCFAPQMKQELNRISDKQSKLLQQRQSLMVQKQK